MMARVRGDTFHQTIGDFMTKSKVRYTGSGPLTYHSAPSGFNYLLDKGCVFEPIEEDIEFFRNIAERANNPFEVVQ